MGDKQDHSFKILLIGDTCVGKSSILLQFTDGYFNEKLQSTIGVDFKVKIMNVTGSDGSSKKVKITIWDTAGQERFRTLTSSYYRGVQGIILVYDVTQKDTFANLETWLNEADQFSTGVGKEAVKLLVGNKVDLPRVVERSEAEAWAKERNMLFIEASAKTTEGITQVFNEAVQKILENPSLLLNSQPTKTAPRGFSITDNSSNSSSCC